MEKRKAECKKEKSNSYHNDVTPDNWRMLLEFFLDIKQGSTSHGYSTYAFDISYPVIFEDF
jgi:hypothetical protein